MRILVTGGGGFLGSTICDYLLSINHRLRIFERPRIPPYRDSVPNANIEWFTGDLASRHDVEKALDDIDAVIHLVSTTLPKSSNEDPIHDVRSNLIPTLQLLDEMIKKNIRKIVFISSGGTVYGVPHSLPISESHSTDPLCSYGITKLAIEKYLTLYKALYGLSPITLRITNPYGPRQRVETAQGAIAAFLNRAISNQPIHIWGDGTVVRDYIYVKDVAEAFGAALKYQGEETLFNIGSGQGWSLNQVVEKIQDLLGRRLVVEYQAPRSFDVPNNIVCIKQATKHLGWHPSTGIDEGLTHTLQWIRDTYTR